MKDGFLIIDKPKNLTSRDVVNMVSKKLNTKKVGHTGTLDPIAIGLLILCVNKATKLIELITNDNKTYIATVQMGILTDTLDITGNIIEKGSSKIDYESLNEVLNSFKGEYLQEVPKYSAVKINGKKLYQYARENKEVILPKRMVNIKDISLISMDNDIFTFKVSVSKGTYIRSLIRYIGNKCHILMTMKELRRINLGNFDINEAINIDDVDIDKIINFKDKLDIPTIIVSLDLEKKITNGARIENIYDSELIMFVNKKDDVLAIYRRCNDEMWPYKVFSHLD